MKLPAVESPTRYQGLYVFDFGDWTAVGYTAEEVALLLESEQYRAGKVYRIHRAFADGRMELQGVAAERFQLESGLLFWRQTRVAAEDDFDAIVAAAEASPPPGRTFLHLADWQSDGGQGRYVTALVIPAELEVEIGAWLGDIGLAPGDSVEGGVSRATNYRDGVKTILDRRQLWSRPAIAARSSAELFASVRRAVQR